MELIKKLTNDRRTQDFSIKKFIFFISWLWSMVISTILIFKVIAFPTALLISAIGPIAYIIFGLLGVTGSLYLGGKSSIFSGLLQTQNGQNCNQIYSPSVEIAEESKEDGDDGPGPKA
jgi:hypothetical protein